MARTTRTIQVVAKDAGAAPVATTIDAALVTAGLEVTDAFEGRGTIILRVNNTAVAAKNVTVQSSDGGAYPLDDYAGAGDLVVNVVNATTKVIRLGDSARYMQAGQSLFVDFEAGFTGTIEVYRVEG